MASLVHASHLGKAENQRVLYRSVTEYHLPFLSCSNVLLVLSPGAYVAMSRVMNNLCGTSFCHEGFHSISLYIFLHLPRFPTIDNSYFVSFIRSISTLIQNKTKTQSGIPRAVNQYFPSDSFYACPSSNTISTSLQRKTNERSAMQKNSRLTPSAI